MTFSPATAALLVVIGVAIGAFGTIVGSGGGFILTPVLLLLYPHDRPATITAISLTAVFFNAASGSAAETERFGNPRHDRCPFKRMSLCRPQRHDSTQSHPRSRARRSAFRETAN